MNRRTAIAAAATTAGVLALAACDPTTGAATSASSAPPKTAAASCTPDFGPDGTGLSVFAGTVSASVTLHCTDTPDADGLISLTLVRQPPGSATATAAGSAAYQHTALSYDTDATCAPGTWALHILWGVTVDGHALSDQRWGKQVTIAAGQCS